MSVLNFAIKRQLPSILQTEQTECSLACLAMVSNYYGHRIDINTMRGKYAISQQGVTLKTIIQIADRMHLSTRALRVDLDEMEKLNLPAILHWDMNHFVVLKSVKSNKIVIHDPAVGIRSIGMRDAGEHFTGVALELSPTDDFKEEDEERRLRLNQLWSKAVGLKRGIAQLLIVSLLIEMYSIVMPYLSQIVIDDVLISKDYDLLRILAIGFCLLVVMRTSTRIIRSYVIMHFSNKMSFQFAVNIYRHLLRLPIEYFAKRHIGDIVSRFNSTERIKEFLASGIVAVIIDGIMVIGTLTMMFIYSRKLTAVALVAVVLYGIVRMITYRYMRMKNEELIVAGAVEDTNFMENIRTIQGIKLFGKETDRISLWQNYFVDVINTGIRVEKLGILLSSINGLLTGTETVLIYYLGAIAVLDNILSIGMLIAFIAWKDNFYANAFALLDKAIEFRLLELHLSRLSDIAFTEEEQKLEGIGLPPDEVCLEGLLEAKDLAFRYSGDHPFIFRDVNLVVDPEETVSIIGPSGCGKSTLIKVLSSLFSPSEGDIKMHNVNIEHIGLRDFRSRVGAVLQDDGLLTGTIADNICFNDPSPNHDAIEYVANLAAIHRDIRGMPMQYNTMVGNLGAALSGGQVQRILIARALYRNPALLFLDEATSHLDLETEKLVNTAIRQLKMARIIVAHRPDTAKLADRIFMLTPQGLQEISPSQFDRRLFGDNRDNVIRI